MKKENEVNSVKNAVSRRTLLKTASTAALGTIAAPAVWGIARAEAKTFVVRDPGGPFEKGFSEAFYKPFEKETGIKVVGVAASHEPVSQIKSIVDTQNYIWDMSLLSMASHNTLRDAGYLEELKVEGSAYDEIRPEFKTPTFCGDDVYSAVIAYRTDKIKNVPKNWADFWNVKDFPGRRGLRKHPFDTLEEAALAAGVAREKVYPIDLDLAFKSLDRIKPDIAIWWTSGAQTSHMLKTGEVDMTTTWNARAQVAIDEGAPVKMVWNNNIAGVDGWVIHRGTPKADLCREFIKFAAQAKQQAAFTPYLTFGPANPNAYKYIDPERAKVLPTYPANYTSAILIDNDYWGREQLRVIEQFNTWILK